MKPAEIKVYVGRLGDIERRIIELKLEIANQERSQHRPVAQPILDRMVEAANRPLKRELDILERKREFIIDARNNLLWRVVWNLAVPIIASLTTYVLIQEFGS